MCMLQRTMSQQQRFFPWRTLAGFEPVRGAFSMTSVPRRATRMGEFSPIVRLLSIENYKSRANARDTLFHSARYALI
jgi:hypothetical protein